MCQAKFNLPAYLRRDCGDNSLAEIEGCGQEGRGCRKGVKSLIDIPIVICYIYIIDF